MLRNQVRKLNAGITVACIVGLALSYYAYDVETAKEKDEKYEAMCDISERISCTKAFSSDYGKGFGFVPKTSPLYLPNSVYGLQFYTLVAALSMFNKHTTTVLTVILGVLSNLWSFYLAYILYLLNVICVICVGTYIVNAAILILSLKKYRALFSCQTRKEKKKRN